MQTDDKKSGFGKAERKIGVFRVAADGFVPAVMPPVKVMKIFKLPPQHRFPILFVRNVRHGKTGDKRGVI